VKRSKQPKAYILLEVILAAGIFAIAGVGLAVALNNISKTYLQARKLSAIRIELASRLNEARIKPVIPGKETVEKKVQGVTYQKEVAPMEFTRINRVQGQTTQIPMNGYYRVTILAKWMEGKIEQTETAEVYVFQP
jgi:hypothetical protein